MTNLPLTTLGFNTYTKAVMTRNVSSASFRKHGLLRSKPRPTPLAHFLCSQSGGKPSKKRLARFYPSEVGPLRARTSSPHFENICLASPLPSYRQNNRLFFSPTRNNSIDWR